MVLSGCSGGIAPPTAAPTSGTSSGPTAAPTSSAAATATAGLLPPGVEYGGTSWGDYPAALGGSDGDRFLYQCPPGGRSSLVWGTDTYTSDSSACTAAVHAGLITFAAGGAVTIEIRPGQSSYVGSTRNGITSSDYASWDSSFVFVGGAVAVPTPSVGPSSAPAAGYGADTPLFSDDFNDTGGGWDVATGPSGSVAYESEKLAIDLTGDVSYLSTSGPIASTPWDVVLIEATLTSTGGNGTNYVGMLCGTSAEDAAGAVVGTDGLHAFIQRTGANYAALEVTQGLAGSLLQNDVPAQVALECAGMSTGSLRLRVSINGAPLDEYIGDTGPQNFQTVSVYFEGKTGASFTLDDVSVFGGDAAGLPPLATGDMAVLLAHVPAAFNVNCSEVTTLSAGEVISVQCTPDIVTGYITYTLFDTEDNVMDKWFGDLDFFAEGVSGSDCSSGPCLVAWERGGFVEGRYFANNYTGVDPNGLIAKWFDEGLLIEAGLVVYDTTFAELYDLALQAGPTP
jgi:hypothetical protein